MSKRWANNGPTFTKGKHRARKPMTDDERAAWQAHKTARQQEVEWRAAKSRKAHKLLRIDPLGLRSGRRGFPIEVNGEAYEAIAVPSEAFETIKAALPPGTVAYEGKVEAEGDRLIWMKTAVLEKLSAMALRGERYSDVILRMAGQSGR